MGRVYILAPGGQYNHLIFRRVLELGFDARMIPLESDLLGLGDVGALVIGGGPGRLSFGGGVSERLKGFFDRLEVPVLGICYGHQLLAHLYGGIVAPSPKPEFGPAQVKVLVRDHLFEGVPDTFTAWLSHNDEVAKLPEGFKVLASSRECAYQAIKNRDRLMYGVQFHVEVEHTQYGREILRNFLGLAKR